MKESQLPAGVTRDDMLQSCERFLQVWHENQRTDFERSYPNGIGGQNYDAYYPKTMKERNTWVCFDKGNEHNRSGVFMMRKSNLHVFVIKGYGVPNLKKDCGHILDMITRFSLATVDNRNLDYNSSSPLP